MENPPAEPGQQLQQPVALDPQAKGPRPSMSVDLRYVCLLLLVIIAAMLFLWRPWITSISARKITVTGNAIVKAVPDEFDFNPSFERTGTDVSKLKSDLNVYGTQLQASLVKLGIAHKDIMLDSSSYANYDYPSQSPSSNQTIALNVTIHAPNKALAQKVQDYLAGTDAKGQLASQPKFSDASQKKLDSQARQQAITDARQKADQEAQNLGAKLGKVITVLDQQDYGSPIALGASSAAGAPSLPVTPGQSEVTASVDVTFALR